MAADTQADLVISMSQEAVQQIAPHEMPIFRRMADELRNKGEQALQPRSGGDAVLGVGSGIEVVLITQVALPIAVEIVKFLVVTVLKEDFGLNRGISATLQRLRGAQSAASSSAPALTDQQLAQLRDIALGRAMELKLPEDQARRLVAALASSLLPGPR
jgi:hypothetical protein